MSNKLKSFVLAATAALALSACSLGAPRDSDAPAASPRGSARDLARIGLLELVSAYEATLQAAAACATVGALPPDTAGRLLELHARGRAAVELVRTGVALSDALLPAGVENAPLVETAGASGELAGALTAVDEVLRVTACASDVATAVTAVREQAAARFAAGARPPLVAFDDALLQIDHHAAALTELAAAN